jgi:hypothetical protein
MDHRDRIRAIRHLQAINQSPWTIGVSHWNQRDLYTRNSEISEDGYGQGPAFHPEDGAYAYTREYRIPAQEPSERNGATLPEREAWPWLNYTSAKEDPYFAHLDRARALHPSLWERVKAAFTSGQAPKNAARPDARILEDVADALTYRGDLDATDIEVLVKDGEVTLEGTVTDRRSKHIAEEVSEGIVGVRDVHNRLTIRKDDPSDANVAFVLPVALMGV